MSTSLTKDQIKAYEEMVSTNQNFRVHVLQGTTGSGKTLVYFERIKRIIGKNNQALVLLPEIFLTNDFKSRFEDFFGFEPAVWHSKITPKKKRKIWKGIINNIYIGISVQFFIRSAIFRYLHSL